MYHDDDDDDDDDDVSGCLPHGSPVPGSGQPRPAAAARPHVLPRNLPPLPGDTSSHSATIYLIYISTNSLHNNCKLYYQLYI